MTSLAAVLQHGLIDGLQLNVLAQCLQLVEMNSLFL